jgi:hypothetical protein
LGNNDSNLWNYCVSAQLSSSKLFRNEFYFGNILSTSNANTAQSALYNFEIKTNATKSGPYNDLPVYRAYAPPTQVTLGTSGNNWAVLGMKLNPSNTAQTTVWVTSVWVDIDALGRDVKIALYKNPTVDVAHSFTANIDRLQFSQLINTSQITSGEPTIFRYANTTQGGGQRSNELKVPEKALGLFDENDVIYLVLNTLLTNNGDCHVGFNYKY